MSQCVEVELFKIAAMASPRDRVALTPSPRPSESLTAPRRAGKGENEQYLVRNAFLNWDKDASGKLDYEEFRADSASVSFNFST